MKTRGISHLAPAAMKKPLAGGKDPGQGSTPLHEACRSGNIRAARRLLDAAADVNAADKNGWTPLHEACNYGWFETVRLLLDSGADVNVRSSGGIAPTHLACKHGDPAVISLLLDRGADVGLVADNSRTALDYILELEEGDPYRGTTLELFREYAPELYFSKFCTAQMSPGGM